MQRIIAAFVTALAVVALPHYAAAQDGKRPERPNPEALFNRLDANHDGVITPNEIPAGMPDRMKNLLLQADKDHDRKLTKSELIEAVNSRHAGPPPGGRGPLAKGPGPQAKVACPLAKGPGPLAKGPGPQAKVACPLAKGPCPLAKGPGPLVKGPGPRPEGRAPVNTSGTGTLVVNGTLVINGGTVIINGGTLVVGGPVPPSKGMIPQGCPMAKPMGRRPMGKAALPPAFDARAIFNRLDTNKDGKLSFEEFSVGLRQLHRVLAARIGEMKGPLQRGMQFAKQRMGNYGGQSFGAKGPMGNHPGMGPMGQPGMGPMGNHPGMGPMGPMGNRPGMGPMGSWNGEVAHGQHGRPDGNKHEMKKPGACKCGATKPGDCKCGTACKCGATKPGTCKCGAACKCGMKKPEAKKPGPHAPSAERASAGNRSIEARLTALETQQAEILKLLRSGAKDRQGRGENGPRHGEHR